MKFNTSNVLMAFVWCIFMGVTAISIGFGALFPSMNRIAKPFVCPNGEMTVDEQVYNPYPGKTVTTETWYCVDSLNGSKAELGIFPMALYAGAIYGFILFVIVFLWMFISSRRSASTSPMAGYSAGSFDSSQNEYGQRERERIHSELASLQNNLRERQGKTRVSADATARMKELKELRDTNMISETEYEEKRKEILKAL